jgi:hypothetical protein
MNDFVFTYCTKCIGKTHQLITEQLNNGKDIVECHCGMSKTVNRILI